MHVVKQGKRVVFEPAARAWDNPDLGGRREFARKVRTLSGNYQLVQLAPWLLSGANPIRFEFISHKLLRLLVPFIGYTFSLLGLFNWSVLQNCARCTGVVLRLEHFGNDALEHGTIQPGCRCGPDLCCTEYRGRCGICQVCYGP